MNRKLALVLFTLTVLLTIIACQAVTPMPALQSATPAIATQVVPVQVQGTSVDLVSQESALVNLFERVSPGIVSIRVSGSNGGSLGSGFVFDLDGHIVTNQHVVEGATQVEVAFPSGYKTYGTVIGVDSDSDLAVIKVNAPKEQLFPLTLGDSSTLKVGQTVVAIGNPFGLSGTMTTGIVSALGRSLQSNRVTSGGAAFSAGDIIQTDAAINPGNSGGPLLNLNGEVIGINRAIRTESFTSQGEPVNSGIGFSISSNMVKRVVPSLIKDGKYVYPYMGISSIDDLSLREVEALGLTEYTGAYVTNVVPGGPAEKAGVRAGSTPSSITGLNKGGDLIVAMDGKSVKTFDELLSYLVTNKSPGDTLVLTVVRGGERVDLTLTLASRP